jgi:hypothetical protein
MHIWRETAVIWLDSICCYRTWCVAYSANYEKKRIRRSEFFFGKTGDGMVA